MNTIPVHKLTLTAPELKALLQKLIVHKYDLTAKMVFELMAHTGVEVQMHPELKNLTMKEFLDI